MGLLRVVVIGLAPLSVCSRSVLEGVRRVVVIVFRILYAIIRRGLTRSAMRWPTSISARRNS